MKIYCYKLFFTNLTLIKSSTNKAEGHKAQNGKSTICPEFRDESDSKLFVKRHFTEFFESFFLEVTFGLSRRKSISYQGPGNERKAKVFPPASDVI